MRLPRRRRRQRHPRLRLKPKGASFELVDREQFVWSVLATDCDFGPDGGFYVSDWVEGWGLPARAASTSSSIRTSSTTPTVKEVKKLLAEGFDQRPVEELAQLLEHKDQRVRQEAQFALAERRRSRHWRMSRPRASKLARLHAIWGLGQIGRKRSEGL